MYVKYHECGYQVIPVKPKDKAPYLPGWSEFCKTKQSRKKIEGYQEKYPIGIDAYNIGICCGPASGIVALDIDTDDKEVLDAAQQSNVVKRGKKGETRFFQYDPSITNQSFYLLDILSSGKMTVVPPSIHPETKRPYEWLTDETLEDVDNGEGLPRDLPKLDLAKLEELKNACAKLKEKTLGIADSKPIGRNEAIKAMACCALTKNKKDVSTVANEIYCYDFKHYAKKRLFKAAKGEQWAGATEQDAKNNAKKFAENVRNSLVKDGKIPAAGWKEDITIDVEQLTLKDIEPPAIIPAWKHKIGPSGTGLLKTIHDTILKASLRDMPNPATGAAIALIGTFACNRFRSNAVWPNMYVLNIADTGTGKSFPAWVANKLIMSIDKNLLGAGSYSSTQGFLRNICVKKERLDILNEFSAVLKQITEKSGPTATLGEVLCDIYTLSDSFYRISWLSELNKDAPSDEDSFNPCINILGSTSKEMFIKYLTKEMVFSGVMNRFLIFTHEGIEDPKWGFEKELDSDLFDTMKFDFKTILDVQKTKNIFDPNLYNPIDLSAQGVDKTYLYDVAHVLNSQLGKLTGIEGKVRSRAAAHVEKLALISAISNGFSRINKRDIDFAAETLDACSHNILHIFNQGAVDNDWQRDLNRVMHFCNQATRNITVSYILNRIGNSLRMDRVAQILNQLEESSHLVKVKSFPKNAWVPTKKQSN